eukprot:CAMPEP_0167822722 /NCGR_PEP_ID=MMETSP0112_2-20121227/7687_1 /TAXON_ID=91324 /ORGANISM="Lotharella globosa, Strain CCCM811" /LENGTH=88 /DNA_ID=CAMNT_0007724187 /DNA_START=9 /DNA_END=273 /DNA_ORIENTATION=+
MALETPKTATIMGNTMANTIMPSILTTIITMTTPRTTTTTTGFLSLEYSKTLHTRTCVHLAYYDCNAQGNDSNRDTMIASIRGEEKQQ